MSKVESICTEKVFTPVDVTEDQLVLLNDLLYGLPSKDLYNKATVLLVRGKNGNLYQVKNRKETLPPLGDFIIWDRVGYNHDFSIVEHKNVIVERVSLTTRGIRTLQALEDRTTLQG